LSARNTDVTVRTISTSAELARLRDSWDALVLAMPRPSPFLLHEWVSAWWQQAEPDGWELAAHVAQRGDRVVGVLPLAVRRKRGLRVAQFAGGHLSALADLLLAPDESPAVARLLVDKAARGSHDLLDVFGLPAGSRLGEAMGPSGLRLIERVEAPVLDLERGWETVYAERTPSKRRSLHRRRRRQLGEMGRLTTTVARGPHEVELALSEAVRLHALRRDGRPDASEFSSRPGGGFQRDALIALAAVDRTRIVTLRLDGRAVAYHCYLWLSRTMYVHSLAFDPQLARWSPGQVTTLDAIATAAEEGAVRVEFLGGAERYKIELADRLEPMHQGLGLARGAPGHAAIAAGAGSIAVRRWAKRSPTVRRLYGEGLAPLRRARSRARTIRSGG
jgi:CelD/BcsL family acetyltransferase involved in cellulose biosynthesis